MEIVVAYGSVAVTLGLVVTRPRVRPGLRIGPAPAAAAGVLIMLAAGVVSLADLGEALAVLARPLVGIVALMVLTASAQRTGLLDRLAAGVFARAGGSATRLFVAVFALAAATAAVLNNDSAVLLLTPAVVGLVRRRWPNAPQLVAPFAFAVFLAAGVAPLVLSNPMNMIVAAYAGIDFNEYARHMAPVALVGAVVGVLAAWLVFRRALASAPDHVDSARARSFLLRPAQVHLLLVLASVLLACPVVAYLGGPVSAVAVAGAIVAAWIASRDAREPAVTVVRDGVAWDVLAFLVLVFLLGVGLRNVGFVAQLSKVYAGTGPFGVGVASAAGSALLNNHPMAILNMLALDAVPGAGERHVLAALVGGDLGPRLLPMGSLAGLLWLDALRRQRVEIPLRTFVAVGFAVTVPTLAASLLLLAR